MAELQALQQQIQQLLQQNQELNARLTAAETHVQHQAGQRLAGAASSGGGVDARLVKQPPDGSARPPRDGGVPRAAHGAEPEEAGPRSLVAYTGIMRRMRRAREERHDAVHEERQVEEGQPEAWRWRRVALAQVLADPLECCVPRPVQRGALVKGRPAEDGHDRVDEEVAEGVARVVPWHF